MNLDKIQINACLRSGMQSLDLGFLMARAWWPSLFLAGAVPALIVFIPLLVFFFDNPFWAGFIIWWLKPFWERLPLYVASRRLFQENPTYADTVISARRLLVYDMLPTLLWRRLSFQRAFDAPVTILEYLRGGERSRRLRVLHGRYTDVALGNQIVCFCFELIVSLGLVLLVFFFTPDVFEIILFETWEQLGLLGQWIWVLTGFVAMTLVMPFHSMAGFSLYLNRRIELEAWDIEISFRNLANRKQQATAGLAGYVAAMLLIGGFVFSEPTEAAVQHNRDSAASLIEQIMQGEEFGQDKTIEVWKLGSCDVEAEDEEIPDWLIEFFDWLEGSFDWEGPGGVATILKILLVAGFLGLLFYLLYRYRGPLGFAGRVKRQEEAPEVLFGLDVRPESLPTDVPAEVLGIWRSGQYRDALSLLYRASLSRLIEKHDLAFRASHTEAECATLVSKQGIESLSRYFSRLTNIWRRLAYGHELPEETTVEELCEDWRREMGSEPA